MDSIGLNSISDDSSTMALLSRFLEGRYEDVLCHPVGEKILAAENDHENLFSAIKMNVKHFLSEQDDDDQNL